MANLEYLIELVNLRLSREERLVQQEFSEYAANRPQVNGRRVLLQVWYRYESPPPPPPQSLFTHQPPPCTVHTHTRTYTVCMCRPCVIIWMHSYAQTCTHLCSQKQFRGPVPECHNHWCVSFEWRPILSCQTKISHLTKKENNTSPSHHNYCEPGLSVAVRPLGFPCDSGGGWRPSSLCAESSCHGDGAQLGAAGS